MVHVSGRWRPLYKTHSIKSLYGYYADLFETHSVFLAANTHVNWTFPAEMTEWVDIIERFDPDGTHSRFPLTKNQETDRVKSSILERPWDAMLKDSQKEGAPCIKAFLSFDDNEELVGSFTFNADPMPELTAALKALASVLNDTHAAMRGELTGTS